MGITTDIDPKKYLILMNGIPIRGFSDGTYFSFEFDEDFYTKKTGADGLTTRIRTNNNCGVATVTLLQSSPSNNILQSIFDLDRYSTRGLPAALMIKNILNLESIISSAAWIKKLPTITQSKDIESREWAIDVVDPIVYVSGNRLFSGQ